MTNGPSFFRFWKKISQMFSLWLNGFYLQSDGPRCRWSEEGILIRWWNLFAVCLLNFWIFCSRISRTESLPTFSFTLKTFTLSFSFRLLKASEILPNAMCLSNILNSSVSRLPEELGSLWFSVLLHSKVQACSFPTYLGSVISFSLHVHRFCLHPSLCMHVPQVHHHVPWPLRWSLKLEQIVWGRGWGGEVDKLDENTKKWDWKASIWKFVTKTPRMNTVTAVYFGWHSKTR